MAYNIFGGNKLINQQVANSLNYGKLDTPDFGSFTNDIFLSTYFYLSKRFGIPAIYDDYKLAGTWDFKVGDFQIRVELNSNWVIFQMFGNARYKDYMFRDPFTVRRWREEERKKDQLIIISHNHKYSERELTILNHLFIEFKAENGIEEEKSDTDLTSQNYSKWYDFVLKYNHKIIGIDFDKFTEKHGRTYSNSETRKALRVLDRFLKNMLTPIWIRDVPYNIKGRCGDSEFDKYIDNIQFDYLKPNKP